MSELQTKIIAIANHKGGCGKTLKAKSAEEGEIWGTSAAGGSELVVLERE